MIEQKLKCLDDDINEACDSEDFEIADKLQQEIDQLKSLLEEYSLQRDNLKLTSISLKDNE